MIVIGLDVHKQSVTAVAVDEAGRPLGDRTVLVGSDELVGWASTLGSERLWAVDTASGTLARDPVATLVGEQGRLRDVVAAPDARPGDQVCRLVGGRPR